MRPSLTKRIKMALARIGQPSVKMHSYIGEDGTIDYERYRKVQDEGNKRKLNYVFVHESTIDAAADIVRAHRSEPTFGLCHGTRRGLEQKWFAEKLGCEVIGTEIAESAKDFPNTIQWDFHEVKPEWVGNVDFIYSNSLDHSYDPAHALRQWMSCLKPGGVCLIEHTSQDLPHKVSELDPFGAELAALPYLFLEWAKGAYSVREIVHLGKKELFRGEDRPTLDYESHLLVLKNNSVSSQQDAQEEEASRA